MLTAQWLLETLWNLSAQSVPASSSLSPSVPPLIPMVSVPSGHSGNRIHHQPLLQVSDTYRGTCGLDKSPSTSNNSLGTLNPQTSVCDNDVCLTTPRPGEILYFFLETLLKDLTIWDCQIRQWRTLVWFPDFKDFLLTFSCILHSLWTSWQLR